MSSPPIPKQGGVTNGSITRAIRGLTIGTVQSYQAKKERDWEDGRDEYDQQFRIPISASTYREPVWTEVTVGFEIWFLSAAPERRNDAQYPIFTYGAEYVSGTPAFLSALVKEWGSTDSRGINSVTLMVGVAFPGAKKQEQFSGFLHVNVQGYGVPVIEDLQEDQQG